MKNLPERKKEITLSAAVTALFCGWGVFLTFLGFFLAFRETSELQAENMPFVYMGVAGIVLAAAGIIVWAVSKKRTYENRLRKAILRTGIGQVDNLSPFEFEEWVARFLRMCGYYAHTTQKSGDFGADVLAEKNGVKIAIQVKKLKTAPWASKACRRPPPPWIFITPPRAGWCPPRNIAQSPPKPLPQSAA